MSSPIKQFKEYCDDLGMETKWYSCVRAADMEKGSFKKLYTLMTKPWKKKEDAVSGFGVMMAIKYLKKVVRI